MHKLFFLSMIILQLHLIKSISSCKKHVDEIAILDSELNRLGKEIDKNEQVKLKLDKELKFWQQQQLVYEAALEEERRKFHALSMSVQSLEDEIQKEHEILKKYEYYNEDLKIKLKAEEKMTEILQNFNSDLRNEIYLLKKDLQLKGQMEHATLSSPTWQRILLLAAKKGDVDEVRRLVDKGIDKSVRDDSGQQLTPLLTAAKHGHINVVQLLLDKGVSLKETSLSLNTALHEAASAGHLDICQLLLDQNTELDPYNKNKETPLQLAKKNGHQNIVNLLVNKGAKP